MNNLPRPMFYVLLATLLFSVTWVSSRYRVDSTYGDVTNVLVKGNQSTPWEILDQFPGWISGEGVQNYQYQIQTESYVFECRLNKEEHSEFEGLTRLRVVYGGYPVGGKHCLYVGL